jgi:hypothetical protein
VAGAIVATKTLVGAFGSSSMAAGRCETGCARLIGLVATGLVIFCAVEELEGEMSVICKSAVLLELMSINVGANGGVAEVLDPAVTGEAGKPWDGDDIRMVSVSVLRAPVDKVGFLDSILVGTWYTGAFPSNVGMDAPAWEIGVTGGPGMPVVVAAGEVGVDAVDPINAFK